LYAVCVHFSQFIYKYAQAIYNSVHFPIFLSRCVISLLTKQYVLLFVKNILPAVSQAINVVYDACLIIYY